MAGLSLVIVYCGLEAEKAKVLAFLAFFLYSPLFKPTVSPCLCPHRPTGPRLSDGCNEHQLLEVCLVKPDMSRGQLEGELYISAVVVYKTPWCTANIYDNVAIF